MLSFECDYNNGAHPEVLRRLVETNDEISSTYGFDRFSESARAKLRSLCGCQKADVFFLCGGTQTNQTVIDSLLHSYEAVICADSGHIAIHEAGAIERSGHKVIALQADNGRLTAETLKQYMEEFHSDESRDHMAQPGMVYLSLPTELGTLYTEQQLSDISRLCLQYGLRLYVDGARLGYALAAGELMPDEDHPIRSLSTLASLCDAFYVGGTKVGALCGEAVIFPHGAPKGFFPLMKQHGALMAKGRLVGVQFDALFTDNLYLLISRHAIQMALQMKQLFRQKGWRFYLDSPTNQQFVVLPNQEVSLLERQVEFTHWAPFDEHHTICRFVTSWATTEEQLKQLSQIISR